jgi:hypothetical protein
MLQLNQISSLTEKRPSITEKELTPIVLNQLQSTKKHKVRKEKWAKERKRARDQFLVVESGKP